jgi:hypothetical protein
MAKTHRQTSSSGKIVLVALAFVIVGFILTSTGVLGPTTQEKAYAEAKALQEELPKLKPKLEALAEAVLESKDDASEKKAILEYVDAYEPYRQKAKTYNDLWLKHGLSDPKKLPPGASPLPSPRFTWIPIDPRDLRRKQ